MTGDESAMWLGPHSIAQHLRCKTWGLEISSVTMPPPQEQVVIKRWRSVDGVPSRAITLFVDISADKYGSRGRSAAYQGSRTVLRTRRSQNQIIDVDNVVRTLQSLTELLPWVTSETEEDLVQLLEKPILEKTTVSVDQLRTACRVIIGGSVTHRLQDQSCKMACMINALSNYSTHVRVVTDTAAHRGVVTDGTWAATLECDSCTRPVDDNDYTVPSAQVPGGHPGREDLILEDPEPDVRIPLENMSGFPNGIVHAFPSVTLERLAKQIYKNPTLVNQNNTRILLALFT